MSANLENSAVPPDWRKSVTFIPVPKSIQTTIQLCSFHMLAWLCSKSFKLGFSNTWTESFQMYNLGLKKAAEPQIKLPTFTGSWKKQRNSRKTDIYFCFIDYTKAIDCVDCIKLWKILKQMGVPDHLTCLLRNPYAGQEATVRTRHRTTDWFQIGKRLWQGCIFSLCLFNLYAEYIMQIARLDESQAGIKRLPGEISTTSDMQMIPPLWQKVKRN